MPMRSVRLVGPGNEDPRSVLVIGVDEPSASTTGLLPGWTKGMLAPYAGPTIITADGTPSVRTYENLLFSDYIDFRGDNIWVDNCYFEGPASPPSSGKALVNTDNLTTGADFIITNSEIAPQAPALWVNGLQGHDFTARYVKIHDCVDSFSIRVPSNPDAALNVIVEQCLAYDHSYFTPDPNHTDNQTHNDGMQLQGGNGTGSRIRGNALWSRRYSANSGSGTQPDRGTGTEDNGRYAQGALVGIQWTNLSGYTTFIEVWDNWIYGYERGINAGSANDHNIGTIYRNKFDDAQGERAGGSLTAGSGYTITMDPTTDCDTGDSSPNQNIYMASVPGIGGNAVTVRRNQ
jgi:hypothetical protein